LSLLKIKKKRNFHPADLVLLSGLAKKKAMASSGPDWELPATANKTFAELMEQGGCVVVYGELRP
jgi:hypothetical protein